MRKASAEKDSRNWVSWVRLVDTEIDKVRRTYGQGRNMSSRKIVYLVIVHLLRKWNHAIDPGAHQGSQTLRWTVSVDNLGQWMSDTHAELRERDIDLIIGPHLRRWSPAAVLDTHPAQSTDNALNMGRLMTNTVDGSMDVKSSRYSDRFCRTLMSHRMSHWIAAVGIRSIAQNQGIRGDLVSQGQWKLAMKSVVHLVKR